MSPVYIKTRITQPDKKTGKISNRYLVYWRRGGRSFKEEYGGSFKTKKEADARREAISAELAAGRDPRIMLDALKTPPVKPATLEHRWDSFDTARVDVGDSAAQQSRSARASWIAVLGAGRDPATIEPADIIDGIAEQRKTKSPSTIVNYLNALAQVLDYADIDPNPARSSKVKLPRRERVETEFPTTELWTAIRGKVRARSLLALDLEEACAFRVSEVCALQVGDLDFIEGMARVRKAKTKAGRRWVPVPGELFDRVEAGLPPLEDRRADQFALGGLDPDTVYDDLVRACTLAGAPRYGTHALRHRRISLWLRHGIDAVQASRWSGHSKPSETTDTYGHVVVDPSKDRWRNFWLETYARERPAGAAQVRHEGVEE